MKNLLPLRAAIVAVALGALIGCNARSAAADAPTNVTRVAKVESCNVYRINPGDGTPRPYIAVCSAGYSYTVAITK